MAEEPACNGLCVDASDLVQVNPGTVAYVHAECPLHVLAAPCPRCGHSNEQHRRESWFDEEGVEGMSCEVCDAGDCQWWTWEWSRVILHPEQVE